MILETTFMGIVSAIMLTMIIVGLVGYNKKVKREQNQNNEK